jgi:predicted esterase
MTVGEQRVPLRLVVPARAAGARGARALVIALHGAGMAENAFVDGYGVGLITRLAARYDAVLVSPATNDFARSPIAFDSLVARLARDHMVDPTRVVVIGHSAGAAAAITLGARRPDGIAAIVALAGAGSVPAGGRIPTTSLVGAELDLIIPDARVRASFEQLRSAGHPVQYQSLPNWGHTLMVGAALPEAFHWLFAPERAGR